MIILVMRLSFSKALGHNSLAKKRPNRSIFGVFDFSNTKDWAIFLVSIQDQFFYRVCGFLSRLASLAVVRCTICMNGRNLLKKTYTPFL